MLNAAKSAKRKHNGDLDLHKKKLSMHVYIINSAAQQQLTSIASPTI